MWGGHWTGAERTWDGDGVFSQVEEKQCKGGWKAQLVDSVNYLVGNV